MDYLLNEYHQGVTEEELLLDLKRVSEQLGGRYLSIKLYREKGTYSDSTYCKRFGSWTTALSKAGLNAIKPQDEMKRIPKHLLICDVKRVARDQGAKTVTSTVYGECGKYSLPTVLERFGSWSSFLEAAGLQPTGFHGRIPEEQLFQEIERIWTALGRQPTTTDMKNGIAYYSLESFTRRFGGWRKALDAFLDWVSADARYEGEGAREVKGDSSKAVPPKKQAASSGCQAATHRTSREPSPKTRFKVLMRDNFTCCACGDSPELTSGLKLEVDHIVPWSKGGETVMDNLQTLCMQCNRGKGDLALED